MERNNRTIMASFDDLGLSPKALAAVASLGYEEPTPVQERAIPLVLEGHDIIAAAKTGTGKTAAFSLPSMDKLGHAKGERGPLMLVVTPTRELAAQIAEVCEAVAKSTHHRVLSVVGCVSYNPQISALKRGTDVLIATPGRLIDLMEQKAAHLDRVEVLVLDEADRMLDMGFLPSVKKIVAATPKTRQTLLFSATIDRSIEGVAGTFLRDPEVVEIAHKGETADTVDQCIVHVPQVLKADLLRATIAAWGHERVIVFARTRSRADATCRRLKRAGYSVEAIHSSRTQNQRRRALENFAAGTTDILVATDVLARGIDVDEVNYVVNYDLPTQAEDYVHRIGRTGRAGAKGRAISFVTPETQEALADIEKFTKREIPEVRIEGFDEEACAVAAAERATKAAAKRDPDIAEAKREMDKREKKKRKAQARAAEECEEARNGNGGRSGKASGKGAKTHNSKKTSHADGQRTRKSSPETSKPTKGAKAQAERSRKGAQAQNEHSRKPQGGATRKQAQSQSGNSRKQAGATKPKGDFRPGRAHRAEVARQHSKRR